MKGKVVVINNDWWTREREPSEKVEFVARRSGGIPSGLKPLKVFAEKLGIGKDRLKNACHAGLLQFERVGREYRTTEVWVEEWLERCKRKYA